MLNQESLRLDQGCREMELVETNTYELMKSFAETQGDKLFLADEKQQYTARETFCTVSAVANRLYALGVRAGMVVALRSPRTLNTALIYYALMFTGGIAMMCDPHDDLKTFLVNNTAVQPDALLTDESGEWVFTMNGESHTIPLFKTDVLEERKFVPMEDVHAPSMLIFTSGSTGVSKAVAISQYATINHSRNMIYRWGCTSESRYSAILPFNHVLGIYCPMTALVGNNFIYFPATLAPARLLEDIAKHNISHIVGVPSLFYAMAKENEVQRLDTSALNTGFMGGAPVPEEQFSYIERWLGIKLINAFGMSEGYGMSCTTFYDSTELRRCSVGRFFAWYTGGILDANGKELPAGQEGELCLKGPVLMVGYYGNEEETNRVIDSEGRFHTGDLAYMDEDGNIYITGRIKDIIIRNGINLLPIRIENAISSLPEVSEATVVGVKHEAYGEVPCALVVLKKGCSMSEEELLERLNGKLAKNELPDRTMFVEAIPLTSSGKHDKQGIKKLFE